jgi:hypothetical protein
LKDIAAAVKLLTKAIGCYGERMLHPISIHWGNGIILRDGEGWMLTGGIDHVAKAIFVLKKGKKK